MHAAEPTALPIEVLLVEDSAGDVRLAREAFRDTDSRLRLHAVSDGVEAMEFLRREGPHALAPRPGIILLDLNLPRMDGREVLAHIKTDSCFRDIPTIILTTSAQESDILYCYQQHANCYLRKPEQWDAFGRIATSIMEFWLTAATLPCGPAGLCVPSASPGYSGNLAMA